jgi:prepilin-type N-terminal cleavage/methylation domain-containing protein
MVSGTPNDEGFSLIELLLVIVILGILATIVVLAVGGMRSDAEDSACLADRRTLEKAGEAYFAQAPAESIPATGAVEPYEQTLVDEGFLRNTSQYYDLDEFGQLVAVPGSPCTL